MLFHPTIGTCTWTQNLMHTALTPDWSFRANEWKWTRRRFGPHAMASTQNYASVMVHVGVSEWEVSALTLGVTKQWLQLALFWKLQMGLPGLWRHFHAWPSDVDPESGSLLLTPPSCLCGSLPGGPSGKEPACQCGRCKKRGFDPWVGKIPWRRARQPTPVFFPGESRGQRSLASYSPWGCRVVQDWSDFSCMPPGLLLLLGVWTLQVVSPSANQVRTDACWENKLKPRRWRWVIELLWWAPEPDMVTCGSHSVGCVWLLISLAVSCSSTLPAPGFSLL